jgi:hypothetical protein
MRWTRLCENRHKNNENKPCALLHTTGGKDEPNFIFIAKPRREKVPGTNKKSLKIPKFTILNCILRFSITFTYSDVCELSLINLAIRYTMLCSPSRVLSINCKKSLEIPKR